MYPYLHVAHAPELTGRDRKILRFLEMVPGGAAWLTLLGMVLAAWLAPVAAAIFIILFDLYWLVKTVYLSVHMQGNWRRMRHHLEIDWKERLEKLKWDHVWQLVILPFYNEPYEVVENCLRALAKSDWPKERMIVVLAREERAEGPDEGRTGEKALEISARVREKYKNVFP